MGENLYLFFYISYLNRLKRNAAFIEIKSQMHLINLQSASVTTFVIAKVLTVCWSGPFRCQNILRSGRPSKGLIVRCSEKLQKTPDVISQTLNIYHAS